MTNDQTIQQSEVVEAPVNIETVTEVTIDPIYKHKDGRIFTKKQLIAKMGLTEDRIKDGISKGTITQVGDTDDPEQQFKHKDGRVFSMKDFASMGVDKDRLASGIEKGMIVPIEKKSQVATTLPPLETQQPKPEVSSTGVAVGESVSTTPPPAGAEVAVTTEVAQAPPPVVEEVKTDFSVTPLEKTKEAVQLQAPLQAQQSNLIIKNDEGQDQPAIITNPNEPVPTVEESTKFWDDLGVKKTPDINLFDNASQYEKLKTAKKKVVLNDGGIPDLGGGAYEAEVDDEEAVKKAREIKQEGLSKKIDYDAIATIGKQVDEYYKDPATNKAVKQNLSDTYLSGDMASFDHGVAQITFLNQLKKGLESHFHPEEANRQIGNILWAYNNLFEQTTKELPDGTIQVTPKNTGNKIPVIQSVYNDLKTHLESGGGIENKEEILDNFRKMVSREFARQAIYHPEYTQVDPLVNSGLNENQIIGFNYISAVVPEELGKYRAALIPDSDIGDNWKAKTAKQQALKALTQIGINIVAPTVTEELKNEISEYNNQVTAFNKNYYFDATPDAVKEMIDYLGEREKRINKLSSMSSRFDRDLTNLNDDSKYGYANYYERQGLLQELTEQRHGAITQPLLQLGRASYNTGATLVDIIKRPFLSDKENEVNLATLMGTNIVLDNELKVAQRNQMEKVPYVMTPTFQASYDDIMNNKSLSDEDKKSKVYDLIVSDPNGVQADIKGKESNLTISSLWYGMTNLAADLAPYLLVEAMTGGTATGGIAPTVMKKFTSSFIAAFATGFHQSYIDAISRGSANPYQDAMRATAISSLAMAGAGTPSIMKSIIGTKSVIGKMVNKMTDKEINAVLRKQPPALLAFRKAYDITGKVVGATKEGFKGGTKMVALTTAAAAINDQMYGEVRDIEEYIDGGKLEILKFTLFGGITGGIARGFKEKYGDLTRSTLYEAAANPKKFLEALEIKIKNNELSKEDAGQIRNNIEQASKIYKSTYFGFTPQKLDAKEQKEQYDALIQQGVKPEDATLAVKELVQKKAQEQPLDDAGKRSLLFLKMQEADLEKTLKNNLPEAQTKKLTNRLLNIKEQINDLRNGIEAPEREQTTIDVLIRGEVIPGDIIKNKTGGVAKVVKVNENKSVLVENLNTGEKFLWKPEDIETEIIEPPREVKPIPVLGPPKPPEPVVEKQTQKQKAPEPDSDIMVSDVIDKGGSYNGKRGIFYLEDQTVVFKEEGTGKEYDLGYINDIKDTPINQYGIKHEESVVSANEDGTFTIRGKVLRNGYSDPTQAVVKDTEGNIVSVTLDMPNGQKRTFKGNVAEDIAYQIHLKEITKDNATTTEFEEFINEPDIKQQIDNATVPATTETTTVTTVEPVQRETLQPTAAEPATTEPTIKAVEREVIVKRMKPFTDRMVKIEREFQNQGYEIDVDFDNEITVTDKDGELIEAEDLPKNLRELAGQYESATAKLGEFDEQARIIALKESREITEVEAEVVTPEKKQIERVTETQQVSTIRNTVAPVGVNQGSLSFGSKGGVRDISKEYPELSKYTDKNLNTASAADLWNLIQMRKPSDWGFKISRNAIVKEFERRGNAIFEELGFSTDGNAMYLNRYGGTPERLSDIFKRANTFSAVAEDWLPVLDYKKEIATVENQMEAYRKRLETEKNKAEISNLEHYIKVGEKSLENLNRAFEKGFGKQEVQRVFTAAELKENPNILEEDPDNYTIGYPDSFVKMGTNVATLKGEGFGEAKVGDVITFSGKEYVVRSIEASKKDPNKARVTLLRVDKEGNILRQKDLSKKEQKEVMATEEEPTEIEAGSEIEFKTAEQKTTKGIKIEIPGLEAIDTILVQDGMTYEVYELATGMKIADAESAMSPKEAVKTIADKIPQGLAQRILQKLYESEEAGRYKIAGEKKGVSITNESPAYNAFKKQKIAEAENRPFASDENTRNELLKMAVQARADGYADAASMIESMANQRAGTAAAPFTVEQAKETLNKVRVKRDLAYRKTENIPFPKSEIEERDPSEQGLVDAIQQGYKRDRWNNLPDEIKNAALEAWKKESAIYNKYGYYPSSFKGGEKFFGVMLTLGRYIGATLSKDPAKREGKIKEDLQAMKENFKRIDEIYKEEGFDVLKAEEGQTPKPLTITETPLPDGARAAFDRIKNRQQQASNATEVERLRAEEKAEYDAMPDPTDEAKRTEIYDRYDLLITPLLKEAEATEPVNISTSVVNFPTNEIKTNTEEYQGRKTLFSERSAKNVAENFDINKFDPIVIYKHPDGNTYVLSGHSRLEGMKRRGEPTIPARVFEGTPEQAKDFALKSNKLGSLQTDIENAAYYRSQLQSGKSYNAIMAEAKENEQAGSAKKIVSYAYLNPNGKTIAAMESLQGSEGDSASNLSAIASKIGDIRARNEHLTDAHENELFDYMVADKNNIPTDKELQDPNSQINRSIAATRFNAEEPLNLNKFTNKSPERTLWEKEKRDLEEQISSYKKEVNANKTTGWSGLKERAIASLATNKSKEAIDRALEDFNNDKNGIKTQYEKILSQKKAELKGLEDKLAKHLLREKDLIEGERGQQSLFSYQETAPKDFEDYVEGVTDMLRESPEKTLQQIQAKVARDFGNNTPEFKKLIEQAYNEAKNNLTSRIVKTEVLQKLNKGFLKIGTIIFDNEMQLLNKAKELSGSRFNAVENTAGFETRDGKPIGFNYDTDQVARERFDFSKLNKIGEGSDRIVFDLGNGKVLKVAKTARGLEQNIYEGDGYLDFIPEIYERGLNYVVVENINRIKGTDLVKIYDPSTGQEIGTVTAAQMFKDLKKFNQNDFDRYNPELQTTLEKYGFADARGYELLYGDFNAARNWGYKDGKAYLIDAGTLGGVDMIKKYRGVQNLSDPDFRKIYYESRDLKKQYADKDKYTKFHYDENGEILGFTHGGQIYLNGQKITAKTTMEEAGHIWINNARETNPNLYKAGLKKVVNSQYLKDVMSSAFYKKEAKKQGPEGSKAYNDYMQEEALAKAIADEGARFVTDAQRISFKEWVDKMWNSVMQAFGIRDLSPDQVAKLSLQDFAKMAAADVFAEPKAEAPAPEVKPVTETAPPLVTTTPVSETVTTPEADGKITTTTTTQTPTGERITRTESFNTNNPFLYEGTEERQRGLYTHLMDADNVSGETKDFFKKNGITYQAASNAQAEVLATDIIKAVGKRDALQIARGSDVHASIRSAIYARSIDNAYVAEANAKTPQEKMRAAQEWKDLVTEYANQLTAGGQFTSYAAHFYRTSPMGFVIKENEDRAARFNEWSKGKEKTLEELWSEINATAEGRSMVNLEVDKIRKAEKEAERKIRDKKIDDFFDQLKVNPKNTYGFIIPLSVLNPVIDGMKIAVKAGDRIADVVKTAIDQISEKVGDNWNKEAFRKDYEQMLTNVVGKQKTLSDEAVQLKNRVTGLEKQIADLKEKIAAGGEPGKKKEAKFSDNPEVQALIEERDRLKKENEDLLKDAKEGKYSDEAKIKAAKQRVVDAINETQRKIDENDLAVKRKTNPTDAELTAYREEQKRLRKELEDMRKDAQEGKYSPIEMAKAEAKRKQARIDELNRRINESDFSAEKQKMQKQKTALDVELEDTKKRYDEAKKQSPEFKEKKSAQFLDRLRKRLQGLSERERNEIVQRSLKQITEAGGLNYEEFRKIVAESMGYRDLTPAEVKEVESLTETINSVDEAEDNLVNNPTEANLKALDNARQNAMVAGLKLYNKTHRPADIPRTFGSLITGSLLGVVTLGKNIIQNVVMQATVRLPKAVIIQPTEAALSWLGNKMAGSKVFNPSTNIFLAQKGAYKGGGRGIKRGWFNFYKGTQERDYFSKTSYQSTLAPIEAVRDLKLYFSGEKPLTKTELFERSIRATIGWQPDFILRAMGFGDRPFRWAAEGSAAIQIAKLELKLTTDNEVNAFMYAPKKYAYKTLIEQGVPKEEAIQRAAEIEDRIIDAGSKAVLEQENALSRVSKWMDQGLATKKDDPLAKRIGFGALSILKTTTFPFVKIPANVYWQMFKVANPEVALLQGIYHGTKAAIESKNGNKAEAKRQYENMKDGMATAVLGYGAMVAISSLVANGYVRPENDEETKAREREGEKVYEKGNQLNWGRMTGGEDFWIDLSWFGPIGTTMAVQAKIQEQNRRKKLKGEEVADSWAEGLVERLSVAQMEALTNLVYDQASRTIGAVKGGAKPLQVWTVNTMNTGMNLFTGATYVQMSKATLPLVPRLKAEGIMEEFKNNQKQRNILYRMYSGMPPSRVSIWGDPIKQNTSFGGVVSNMLGFQETDAHQFGAILYYDAQRTGDTRFFPAPVTDKITVDGVEIKLTQDQKDELATYVGQARSTLAGSFVYNMSYLYRIPVKGGEAKKVSYNDKDMTDADKVHALEMIYEQGKRSGFAKFQQMHKEFAPAVLTAEELGKQIKREVYDYDFKMNLEKTLRNEGKTIPTPNKEEELQKEIDELNEEAKKQFEQNNPE